MKSELESFEVVTGWSGTGSVAVHALNEIPEYIASLNTKSLIFKFPKGSSGESISKSISPTVPVGNYNTLVFSLYSREKKRSDYRRASECSYKLTLDGVTEYFIRTFPTFTHETIDISDVSTIDQIKITCLHGDEDYLLMSAMFIEKQELPLDIFDGVAEYLDYLFNINHGKGISLGTISGSAGATSLVLASGFIGRYSVVYIDDGANSETHQLGEQSITGFGLSDLFDGPTLLSTYTDAPIYLIFPARAGIGSSEVEIQLPGFSIWGLVPTPVDRGNDLDTFLDTFKALTIGVREEGRIVSYPILIDAEARSYEILAYMQTLIKKAFKTHTLWINGRKNDIVWDEIPIEVEPTESFDIIPKIQYTLNVEVKEELWAREHQVLADPATLTWTPESQGQVL